MVVLVLGVLGALLGFHHAQRGLDDGARATRALALAESRLDAKRGTAWRQLLQDDLDGDGRFEGTMRAGGGPVFGGEGGHAYRAGWSEGGVDLTWSVTPDRPGPLWQVGSVMIQVRARYHAHRGGWREVRLGAIRANPSYIGARGTSSSMVQATGAGGGPQGSSDERVTDGA